MSQPRTTNPIDDDHLILTLIGIAAIPAAIAYAAATWTTTSQWLITHRLLVPADQHPLLTLPGGAGLDLARIVLTAAVLAAAGILTTTTWQARARREELR